MLLAVTTLVLTSAIAHAAAPEPYAPLNSGSFSGSAVPLSPDPLVRFVWNLSAVNASNLQVFNAYPTSVTLRSGSSFANLNSVVGQSDTAGCSVGVAGQGSFMVDFGTELAAWLELDSPDLLQGDVPLIQIGIGEWTEPQKQGVPVVYSSGGITTLRLETNSLLYEGVRFGFVSITGTPSKPFTIAAFRAVSQTKAVNYVGSFSSPGDNNLTQMWYTAAYTVRLNLEAQYFGAILVDRGDRIAWTGDDHVAQAASLATFANAEFVLQNLNATSLDCNNIESYCIYWVLSVLDYWEFTASNDALIGFASNIAARLEHAHTEWDNYGLNLEFYGWDDRLGAGFANASTLESQYAYRFLCLRTFLAFADAMEAVGNNLTAAHFRAYAAEDASALRTRLGAAWPASLGVHAAADALNVPGFASEGDVAYILTHQFNSLVTICSLSNFNQYWILQALGNAGAMDRAVASIHACWGNELQLGASSFWEISSPDWAGLFRPNAPVPYGMNGATSLCHPWSAGVLPWLSAHVMGITLAGGAVRIAPHLTAAMTAGGGLAGGLATPHGAVRLWINTTGATVSGEGAEEEACGGTGPAGVVHLRVQVPSAFTDGARLLLSEVLLHRMGWGPGEAGSAPPTFSFLLRDLEAPCVGAGAAAGTSAVMVASFSEKDAEAGPRWEYPGGAFSAVRSRVVGVQLPPGDHVLTLQQRSVAWNAADAVGGTALGPFPPASWPGRFIRADTTTQGSWLGRYGASGYVLFSFGSSVGANVASLPPWVAAVTKFQANDNVWVDPAPASDPRALQDPRGSTYPRAIGCVFGSSSTAIDISLASPATGGWYQLSVYVVDFDYGRPSHQGLPQRRQTLTVLEGEGLNPAAPVQLVDGFVGGAYLVYQFNSSVRVRVSQLAGDNAVISAVFFDPAPTSGAAAALLRGATSSA